MEFVVYHLIELLISVDQAFQKRIHSVIPATHDFWRDPQTALQKEVIVIGPLRRPVMSSAIGLFFGFMCWFTVTMIFIENRGPNDPRAGWPILIPVCGAPAFVSVALGIVIARWLRGGEIVLRAHGLVLRRRGESVYLPWSFFHASKGAYTQGRTYLLICPACNDGVVQSRDGFVVASGRWIRSRQFYFRKDGLAVIKNWYAVRIADLCQVFCHVARFVGPRSPTPPTLQSGEPIPELFI